VQKAEDFTIPCARGTGILPLFSDDSNSTGVTPKNAIVAGVKFHRTKTGNFVISRIVKDHRYVVPAAANDKLSFVDNHSRSGNVKKIDEPCRIFSSTGTFLSFNSQQGYWLSC
jgi:hypothetical protein